jgi:hypothetical protein
MGGGSFENSRGRRAQTSFGLDARAFDEEAVPARALAAKIDVKASKRLDLLGQGQPVWNKSTVTEDFKNFPERPLMRTLSKFDSHKRAEYNFRAEVLDNSERRMYLTAGGSKFQYTERHIVAPGGRAIAPPSILRCEYAVHPALEDKVR